MSRMTDRCIIMDEHDGGYNDLKLHFDSFGCVNAEKLT